MAVTSVTDPIGTRYRFSATRASTGSSAASPVLDAALRCIARWGVAKTTLDDVAKEAGVSRASVYRAFPGGKEALLDGLVGYEVASFVARIAGTIEEAATLGDALVAAVVRAARDIADHDGLQYLLVHEPGLVLPHLSFGRMDDLLAEVRSVGAPLLARFLDGDLARAERVAEWVARITLSYSFSPSPDVDLTDERSARDLVETFVLPGIANLANP